MKTNRVKDTHIMIDLETLGTDHDSIFISVGAVKFDPYEGTLGEEFYMVVDWQSSIDQGRTFTADTLKWWFGQSDEARKAVTKEGEYLLHVLLSLRDFIGKGNHKVWANGSTFDISMLEDAYKSAKHPVPWKYWNTRDVRTIKELAEGRYNKEILKMVGVAHNALDDARHQAIYTSAMYQALRKW